MSIGSPSDMLSRLKRELPGTWFPDVTARMDAVLSGAALVWAFVYDGVEKVRLQTRLATASDGDLDKLAFDYLGARVIRATAEPDEVFRQRVRREVLREKVTRRSVSTSLQDLTGHQPVIVEPERATDTGGWDTSALAFDAAGAWGSRLLPHQAFVTAFQPPLHGPPGISGWDCPAGGWGTGAFALQDRRAMLQGATDDAIRAAVTDTIAEGTVVWLRIRPYTEARDEPLLDLDFVLDQSATS